jgi:hypothetical protein
MGPYGRNSCAFDEISGMAVSAPSLLKIQSKNFLMIALGSRAVPDYDAVLKIL